MFQSARLQLTFWYVLIVMFISVAFSFGIFRALSNEVERFARIQRIRIERGMFYQEFVPGQDWFHPTGPAISDSDLPLVVDTERRLMVALAIINGCVLIIAGGLCYLLAGRTLQPIQEMVDEQNRFISDASHELKTPLTSLKSAFEVYLRDKQRTKHDADQIITESIDEVNKLQKLSDSLLQLAQVEQTFDEIELEPIQVTEVIEQAVKQVLPISRKKEIDIAIKSEKVEAIGDTQSLVQLLVILLDNAIKYSPEKSVIELSLKSKKGTVNLTVTDHGIGIAKDDLEHIFDRFYRADSARTKVGRNGYGLGLSIAEQLADLNDAKIEVTSKVGHGTSFTVYLKPSKA